MNTKSSSNDLARRLLAAASRGLLVLLAYSVAALATGFRNGIPVDPHSGHIDPMQTLLLVSVGPTLFPLGLGQVFWELLGGANLERFAAEGGIVASLLSKVIFAGPYLLYALFLPAAAFATKRWQFIALIIILLATLAVTAGGCGRVDLMP